MNKRAALCAAVAILAALPLSAQRKQLTVERIYGQPSLSGSNLSLQWSPDGKRLSYQQRGAARGTAADIWVIDAASGQRSVLVEGAKITALIPQAEERGTVATGLGRAARQSYQWAPDSSALLFTAQGNLYWWDLKTQTGKRLTSSGPQKPAEDAKFSPDAKSVSFVRDYDLWTVSLATGKEAQVTRGGTEEVMNGALDWVYPEELRARTAYWWSPDSKQIAFLQMDERPVKRFPLVNHLSYTGEVTWERYPKAGDPNPIVSLYVVSAAGGAPRLLGTTKEDGYIPRVAWLPDSRRIAMQKLNRLQNKLELFFVEAATGKATLVLSEEDKAFVSVDIDPIFLDGGKRFLWSSERDGFQHLYLHDMSGTLIRQVTRGQWEIGAVTGVEEKSGAVYFTASEKSATERHLYRASIETGAAPARLTQEEGTHNISMSPGAAYYVDSYSNAVTPARQDLYRADGVRAFVIGENKVAELAEYGLVTPEFSTISDGRGGTLNTMMIKPPDFDPAKKYPAIMYTYGGPGSQVVNKSWGGARGLWHQMMAQKGYVIFLADNGGAAGRGHAAAAAMYRNLGDVEVAEQVTAANWLKAQPYIDPERVGIWGWSYGGYMASMLMTKTAGVWKAGFAGAPVTDWRQYDSIYTERYMSTPQLNPEGYAKSAPTAYAANLKGKLMIAHGTGDDNVHFTNTLKFQEEFIRAGKYVEIAFYPGRGHGVGDPPAQRQLWTRVTQFFLDNL